jgi:aminoglycoside/choline kinase family phosphotransferase
MSLTPEREQQILTFLQGTPFEAAQLFPLAGDASFRRYIRLHKGDARAMLMDAPVDKEDVRPFVATATYLHGEGFSAPAILAKQPETGLLLLEDLGDDSYSRLLKSGDAELETRLYGAAIDVLAQWHDAGRGFSNPAQLALPAYDRAMLLREVALLPEWFLPQVVGKEKAAQLQPEFMEIWGKILDWAGLATRLWVHRDYHAENLLWLPDRSGLARVGMIDFQDAVSGHPAWDLLHLLQDARRDVAPELETAMLDRYLAARGPALDRETFLHDYRALAALNAARILGRVFARQEVLFRRARYTAFMPRTWRHLERDLEVGGLHDLKQWFDRHVPADNRVAENRS